jgi:hypothetical protein
MTIERDDQHERGFASELSQPARRALTAAGYRRLEQLTTISEAEIKQLHGIGPHAIDQLRRALAANGWSFADRTRT